MADRPGTPPWREWVRWSAVVVAIGVLVVFLGAQSRDADVSFADSPSSQYNEGAAGELSGAVLPSVATMTDMVAAKQVVVLDGAVAHWDPAVIDPMIQGTDVRILVAPPGLTKDQEKEIRDVTGPTIRIIGTNVSGVAASTFPEWERQFGTRDITSLLAVTIASETDGPAPAAALPLPRRDPTSAELAPVLRDLRGESGVHAAPGTTLTKIPAAAQSAFPPGRVLYAAFPYQPVGEPIPDFGPALTAQFPDTPIVVMYGEWVELYGPGREVSDVVAAAFYGQFGDRLSRFAYPQWNVLGVYLKQLTDVRYAGVYDLPLPYRPVDPVGVALPALPWIFGGCAVLFLVLSITPLVRTRPSTQLRAPSTASTVRLAGLNALAIEISGLTGATEDPALTRGISRLRSAAAAMGKRLPERQIRSQLDRAEAELDTAARLLDRPEYRPAAYLAGRLG